MGAISIDKENISVVEYETNFGWGDVEMVAIYNKKNISEMEVKKLIRRALESKDVIHITKKQYENVFGDVHSS